MRHTAAEWSLLYTHSYIREQIVQNYTPGTAGVCVMPLLSHHGQGISLLLVLLLFYYHVLSATTTTVTSVACYTV